MSVEEGIAYYNSLSKEEQLEIQKNINKLLYSKNPNRLNNIISTPDFPDEDDFEDDEENDFDPKPDYDIDFD